MKCIFRLHF